MSFCIYDLKKICDSCNDCRCDFDSNKICDNCGKCLQTEEGDFETRAIKIDKVFSEDSDINNETENDFTDDNTFIDDDYTSTSDAYDISSKDNPEIKMEFIDDVDGLSDVLYDEKKFNKVMYEQFPGFIKIKKGKKDI